MTETEFLCQTHEAKNEVEYPVLRAFCEYFDELWMTSQVKQVSFDRYTI